MNLIGAEHPFWRVAWRRYAVTASAAAWAVLEWVIGDPFWAVVFTGITGLAFYELIYIYKPPVDKGDQHAKS